MKICKKCGNEKPLDDFHRNGKYIKSGCKTCNNKMNRERQRGNIEYAERAKRYRETNRERIKETDRIYNASEAGREATYRRNMRRRSRAAGVDFDDHSKREILDAYDWRCANCGCEVHDLQLSFGEMTQTEIAHKACIDHIVPLRMGGPSIRSNLQCLCNICNCRKHTMDAEYYGFTIGNSKR